MVINKIESMKKYVYFLRTHKEELQKKTLFEDLLIGVTNFFRDPDDFTVFPERDLPLH